VCVCVFVVQARSSCLQKTLVTDYINQFQFSSLTEAIDNQLSSESILGILQVIMKILVKNSTFNIMLKFRCKVGCLVFSVY